MENLENNMKENINDKKIENVPVTPKKKKKKFFRWLKKTLGFLFLELFKAIFRLIILGLAIFTISKLIKIDNRKPSVPEKVYLEVSLVEKVNENRIKNPFDIDNKMNFYGFLKKLNQIKNDKRVQGIIFKLGYMSLNNAQIEELKLKISELKYSGKKIYVYSENLDNRNYSLALEADKIIMPNNSWAGSDISGYSARYPYYKNLGDNLLISANVIHIGDYKSMGENYTSSKMSEEFKANTKRILDKRYMNFVSDIALKRGIPENLINKKILEGDFVMSSPKVLRESNLIDETIYYEDFIKENKIDSKITIEEYFERVAEELEYKIEKKDKIAIIYAEGTIVSEDSPKIENKVTPKDIKEKLAKADELPNVKGIVLRINSPGGSALASDIIYEAVRTTEIPVYISMGGVAASGGYYIASAGDKIYSDKGTITGSIGVVSIIPDLSKLAEKIGIDFDEISNGKYTNLYNITKPLSDDEKEKIYKSSLIGYNEFVEKVALGRKMSVEDVQKIAEGRVWLGEEAKDLGLVDEIGGLEKTISDLAKDLNLKEYEVIESLESRKLEEILKKFLPKYIFSSVLMDKNISKIIPKYDLSEELFYKPIVYTPNLETFY